jgi:hypothetical protein
MKAVVPEPRQAFGLAPTKMAHENALEPSMSGRPLRLRLSARVEGFHAVRWRQAGGESPYPPCLMRARPKRSANSASEWGRGSNGDLSAPPLSHPMIRASTRGGNRTKTNGLPKAGWVHSPGWDETAPFDSGRCLIDCQAGSMGSNRNHVAGLEGLRSQYTVRSGL